MSAQHRWINLALVVGLLAVGFCLRTYALTESPPGTDDDEMFYYLDANAVLEGRLQIYYETNYGHEPLFIYAEALMVALTGRHAFVLRYTAVLGGMLSLSISYALARRLFNRRVAWVTLALFATLFWPVFITRTAMRTFTLPLVGMFAMYTLWRALQDRSWRWTLAAGGFNGLVLYTYTAARVFPAIIIGWLAAMAIFHRARLKGNWLRTGVCLALAALIMLPLVMYAVQHQEAYGARLVTMGGPFFELQRGEFGGLWKNILDTAGMFTVKGDEPRYNAYGWPIFNPGLGIFFYVGLALAVWRWRRPAFMLVLLCLLIGLLPTLLSSNAPSDTRSGGALFAILVLPGVGADWVWEGLCRRRHFTGWAKVFPLGVSLGALVLGGITLYGFFGPWRMDPAVTKPYETGLHLAARYLLEHPPSPQTTVFVVHQSAMDDAQVIFGLQSAARVQVRYVTPNGLVWPEGSGEVWYLFCDTSAPDAQTLNWLGVPLLYRQVNGAGAPLLEVYRWPAAPPAPAPQVSAPARFDQLLDFLGVTYPQPLVRGQSAEAILFWRVRADRNLDFTDRPLIRMRLVSHDFIWGDARGGGPLAYSPVQWQTGDVWAQRVTFDIPPDMPPHAVTPELMVTTRQRVWPVIAENEELARQQFYLPPVMVTGQPVTTTAPAVTAPRFGDALALLTWSGPQTAAPGMPLAVQTTWQALRAFDQDYAVQLQLLNAEQREVASVSRVLWQDVYPAHLWQAGERVTSRATLPVPADMALGDYQLQLRLVDQLGQPVGDGGWVKVGAVKISGRAHQFTLPAVDKALDVEFGAVARLVGYRLDATDARRGGRLRLTLVWQARKASDTPLKVFTHLYDLHDRVQVYAQHDGEPVNGGAPTPLWVPGEYIEDEHVIPLAADLAAGDYRLGVGMYDSESFQRVALISAQGAQDALILTQLNIP